MESLHWWKYDDGAQYDLVEVGGRLMRRSVVGDHLCGFHPEVEPFVRSLLARAVAAESERDLLRQTLDDSTDPLARAMVQEALERSRRGKEEG